MKHLAYAVLSAALAMLLTSGALVLATAAPSSTNAQQVAEAELAEHLDVLVAAQLTAAQGPSRRQPISS